MKTVHRVNSYRDNITTCGIPYDNRIWASTNRGEINCKQCGAITTENAIRKYNLSPDVAREVRSRSRRK